MEIARKKKLVPMVPDFNVFDIMQGVAITTFIKTGKKKQMNLEKFFIVIC